MMLSMKIKITSFFLCILMSMSLAAQTIKVASIAPEATPWGQGLNQIAAEWSRATNGRVRLKIFHGGVAGSEIDVVRKMRLGQLQGMTASPLGLNTMVPKLWGLSLPGIIQTGEELDYILVEFEEELNTAFREAGYEILTWSNSGWLNFFTRDPIPAPGDLRGMKIASTGYDEGFNTILRNLGMQTVNTSSTEVLTGLNSGLLDALIYAPLGVAAFQWFAIADNMLTLQIAPFFGAVVMDVRSWKRIPSQYHDELKEIAKKVGAGMEDELDELEAQALGLMQEFGLDVIDPSASELEEWYKVFADARQEWDARYFSDPLMARIKSSLEEFRNR